MNHQIVTIILIKYFNINNVHFSFNCCIKLNNKYYIDLGFKFLFYFIFFLMMKLEQVGEYVEGITTCKRFIAEDKEKAGIAIAEYICFKINEKQKNNKHDKFVLGLATGSTPKPIIKN